MSTRASPDICQDYKEKDDDDALKKRACVFIITSLTERVPRILDLASLPFPLDVHVDHRV